MSIYVLSRQKLYSSVSNDPLFELENLLVRLCDGQLLVPTARDVRQWTHEHPGTVAAEILNKIVRRTIGFYKLEDDSFQLMDRPRILFIIGISGDEIGILSAIPKWRQTFDVVVAYIFDAWGFNSYPKYTNQIDHLFVPMPELIEPLQKYLGISVSLLPFGMDALTYGSGELDRPIDLTSYGRIPGHYHRAFAKAFNQTGSAQIYYHATPRRPEYFLKNLYEDRRDKEDWMLLFKILSRTKLAIAFDSIYPDMRQFPHSFVTLRWFECGAAGCGIIGKRPTTPLADKLLDWEDATIELPDDPQESVEFVKELLQDKPRLNSIHKRNYAHNLSRHDWRLRIKSIFEQLDLPLPKRLVEELSQLKTLHAQISG